MTVGSVYGWDSAAHDSGFSLWLGHCDTLHWVQCMAGTVQQMTVGSVHGRGRCTKQWTPEECLQGSESFVITSATLVEVIT